MEVGTAASGAKTAGDLEVAQVIHEARAAWAIVVTSDTTATPATASTWSIYALSTPRCRQ